MASSCDSDMDHSTATPPATPSHASTLPTASSERSSIPVEPPRMDNRADFTAFPHIPDVVDIDMPQMLMKTPITVECGPKLQTKLTMHEEMLCCHSKQLQARFTKAKPTREQYAKADQFRDRLAAYVFPETTPKEFEDNQYEQQVKPLIRKASENYPLVGYATNIKKLIIDAVAAEISAKNVKKTAQRPAPDLSLAGRLELLKSHGVQNVAAKLYARVHAVNKTETKKAESDPLKAAAQHRILLPHVEEATVKSFMQWIYRGTFSYEGSEQLYSILKLATQLGVEALARVCLNQLYDTATDSLKRISQDGTSLQTLLGYGPDATTDDIVGVVFKHAVKDETTPRELKGLVIDTLAASLDTELWMHVKHMVNPGMALQIIDAMLILRQHVKTEMYEEHEQEHDGIKSESGCVTSASVPTLNPAEDDKSSDIGEQDGAHA